MKKILQIGLVILLAISIRVQNLVPNPSFESADCQTSFVLPFGCSVDNNPPWVQPSQGSCDSFHECHTGDFGNYGVPSNFQGSQLPMGVGDQGYAGVITYEVIGADYREYIQVQLTEPLTAGEEYHIGFFCSLGDNAQYAADGLGMAVTNTQVISPSQNLISATPQIVSEVNNNSSDWSEVSGTYLANGGESYITIGNFFGDSELTIVETGTGTYERAFYYVDEVYVIPANPDGISDQLLDNNELIISPNPAKTEVSFSIDNSETSEIRVYNIMGQLMTSEIAVKSGLNHVVSIDLTNLKEGVYTIKLGNKMGKFIKVK